MVVFSSVSSDAGFGGLASNLVVHFKILQNRFKDRRFEDDDQSLEDLIEYHTLVLKLSRRLMSSFRIIILNNLLVASVLLCVLGFEMVVYLGTSLMLLYITYITAIVIQIFFFSYYGSQLLYEVLRSYRFICFKMLQLFFRVPQLVTPSIVATGTKQPQKPENFCCFASRERKFRLIPKWASWWHRCQRFVRYLSSPHFVKLIFQSSSLLDREFCWIICCSTSVLYRRLKQILY